MGAGVSQEILVEWDYTQILTPLRGQAVLNALWHLHGVFTTAQQ